MAILLRLFYFSNGLKVKIMVWANNIINGGLLMSRVSCFVIAYLFMAVFLLPCSFVVRRQIRKQTRKARHKQSIKAGNKQNK